MSAAFFWNTKVKIKTFYKIIYGNPNMGPKMEEPKPVLSSKPKIEEPELVPSTKPKWRNFTCSQRLITSIMCFLCIAIGYNGIVIMAVVLTAIAPKPKSLNLLNISFYENDCNSNNIFFKYSNEYDEQTGTFSWSQWEQGNILSAFFIGYTIAQVPSGVLSEKYGGKIVLTIGLTVNGIICLFIHVATLYGGYYAICACRIIQGLSQGTIFPSLSYFLAKWIPKKERGRYGSFVYGGAMMGALTGNLSSGLLVNYVLWSAPFYWSALLSLSWVFFFTILCTNDPLSHPRIKQSEKDYLVTEMGDHVKKEVPKKPWKRIFKSRVCYVYYFAIITYDWGFYTIAIDLPKFLNDVVKVDKTHNAFYSSVPFLIQWICSIIAGFVADYLYLKKNFTITTIRKIMTTICLAIPAVLIYIAGFVESEYVIVIIFTLAMGFMGTFYAGIKLNALDMSPNFAPTISAFGNGMGAATGFLVPNFIGFMTPDVTRKQWQNVFLITLCLRLSGTIVYLLFSSSEIQPWDKPEPVEEQKVPEKKK